MSDLPVPVVSQPDAPQPRIAADVLEDLNARSLVCANCHAPLTGEYCAACGQRHEPHIHTVAHFAAEAFESLSHADSRLWRTLWYLFARPGFLTREFFAGRRVAYLPPFRLYLVLSVLFFLLTTLPSGDSALSSEPLARGSAPAAGLAKPAADSAASTEQKVRELAQEQARLAIEQVAKADPQAALPDAKAEDDVDFEVKVTGLDEFCEPFEDADRGGSGATARRNVRQFCNKVQNDSSALFEAMLHNLPRAMFIFLPLLAAIMKLMYWRPKRYYVEHLLFLVHNHAAVFLVLSLVALLSLLPWVGDLSVLLVFIALGYLSWYIFRAMRNVYGQHGALTFLKYAVLGWTYVVTAFFTLLLTLIFLALIG
jgi:hypothetical protein